MAYRDDFMDDRNRIEAFLNETETLLKDIAYGKIELKDGPILPEKAKPLAVSAIEEYLENALPSRYKDAAYLPSAETLFKGGLRGKQFDFKLSLVGELKERFKKTSIRRILLKLLDAIDNALDTLVALAGVDHALKELKDTLRGWIDEAGEG